MEKNTSEVSQGYFPFLYRFCMSGSLRAAGFDLSSFKGHREPATINGQTYRLPARAYELWEWLEKTYMGTTTSDGKFTYSELIYHGKGKAVNVLRFFQGERGIYA